MLCNDIIRHVSEFLSFKDIYNLKQTCLDYKIIPYPSLKKSFSETINLKLNLDKDDAFGKNLLGIISEHNELSISGELILEILHQELYSSDMEIYVHVNFDYEKDLMKSELSKELDKSESYKKLSFYLKQNNFKISSWERTSFWLHSYFVNRNKKEIKITFIPIPMEEKVNKTVDITFCNNYYDGNILFLSNPNDIFNKSGKLNSYSSENLKYFADLDDFTSDFEKVLLHQRSFINKGYQVLLDRNIFEFEKDDDVKVQITDEMISVSIENEFAGIYGYYTFKAHSQDKDFVIDTKFSSKVE
jgi:hypothetical protein